MELETELQKTIPCVPEGVYLARSAVASNLAHRFPPSVLHSVLLLTSEVVTNAVLHSGCREDERIRLRTQVADDVVRVEVQDGGRGFEKPMDTGESLEQAGKYGLRFVESIARDWGVRGPPTTVWFEVSAFR